MKEQIKYPMPQIDEQTGVSNDYSNEITTLRVYFLDGNKEKIINKIKEYGIKKYEERYPLNRYNNVITEKNKDAVNRLNQLAERMNQFAKDEVFNNEEFTSTYNEMIGLIYGSGHDSSKIKPEDFGKWNK